MEHSLLVNLNPSMLSATDSEDIDDITYCYDANQSLIGRWKKGFFCSVIGKFEYQKKFDVNVCKQISSL